MLTIVYVTLVILTKNWLFQFGLSNQGRVEIVSTNKFLTQSLHDLSTVLTGIYDPSEKIVEDGAESFGVEHPVQSADEDSLLRVKLLRGAANETERKSAFKKRERNWQDVQKYGIIAAHGGYTQP